MNSILFLPFQKTAKPDGRKTVLELAREIGISLPASCGGKKKCGKCKIVVEKADNPLPHPSRRELEILGDLIGQGYRLACQTVVTGGAVVRVPEESISRRHVILTSDTAYPYPASLRPPVRSYYLEVPAPTLESATADRERLIQALEQTWNIRRPNIDPFVLRTLPGVLRSGEKGVTVVVRDKREVVDVRPGRDDALFGMAFDIGTTTVVGYLIDLNTGKKAAVVSALNPQIAYGDDVITRIAFCRQQTGGLETLRSSIVACVNSLIKEAGAQAGIDPGRIVEMTAVGNTAMHHLFAGLDPHYVAMAPYAPVLREVQDFKARDLGVAINESASVHLPPLKAGFVGSDAVSCAVATRIHRSGAPTLLVDLGTNGEIVFGNKERLMCCSTAAGPAFEGGHITWGMRAAAGAIDRAKIDPANLDVTVHTIDDQPAVGLCGSGIISAVAEMIRAGIVLERGQFDEALQSERLRDGDHGREFVLVKAKETGVGRDIVITRKDVSELQMAKAAIHAGASVLIELFGCEKVTRILLAGAGGNFIDPQDACTIGLFPQCNSAKVVGVGNAAGHGSCLALLDRRKRREAERIAKKLEYKELATSPRFRELFASGLIFTEARDYEGRGEGN